MQRFASHQPGAINFEMGGTSALRFDFFELMTRMMTDPVAVARAQIDLFYNSLGIWQKTAERMLMLRARETDAPKDKRFRHPDWSENAIFDFVKDSYLVAAESILSAIREVKGMDEASARRVNFYTRQFVDALSPWDTVTTNPEVLTATLESGGQNLLRRLENLLADLERGNGQLAITMTDMNAFRLGENIATTPGKIVYQSGLIRLIPVYAVDKRSQEAAVADRPTMDQQVLCSRSTAEELLHQMGRRSGTYGVRYLLGQSR